MEINTRNDTVKEDAFNKKKNTTLQHNESENEDKTGEFLCVALLFRCESWTGMEALEIRVKKN